MTAGYSAYYHNLQDLPYDRSQAESGVLEAFAGYWKVCCHSELILIDKAVNQSQGHRKPTISPDPFHNSEADDPVQQL